MDDSFSGVLGCTIGRGLDRERTLDRLKRKRKTPLPENMVVVFFITLKYPLTLFPLITLFSNFLLSFLVVGWLDFLLVVKCSLHKYEKISTAIFDVMHSKIFLMCFKICQILHYFITLQAALRRRKFPRGIGK